MLSAVSPTGTVKAWSQVKGLEQARYHTICCDIRLGLRSSPSGSGDVCSLRGLRSGCQVEAESLPHGFIKAMKDM